MVLQDPGIEFFKNYFTQSSPYWWVMEYPQVQKSKKLKLKEVEEIIWATSWRDQMEEYD